MRRPLTAYALAIAALVAAVLLRWLLDPVIGDALPLVTLFGAVAAAVWIAGYRVALAIAILGYLASSYLFIEPRGAIRFDEAGTVVGFGAYLFACSLIIGIGQAMRTAQLRAGERGELLRVTLGSIGDAVIATDTNGRVTYMNSVAESLTGWTQREAAGQPLETVFHIVNEQTRQEVENPALKALREGTVVGLANHSVLIGKDGVERPVDDSAAPIKDDQGRVSGSVLVFRDISERRRWEQDEANRFLAARQLAAIVASSDDAIVRKSLDGIIQSWNAGAERLFGYSAAEAVGRHISLIIPPDRIAEEDDIIASLKAGKRVDHFETRRRRKDGRLLQVSLTISPIEDEAGNIVAASKIVRDVTRQRQAEERERRLLEQAAAANAKFRAFFDQGVVFAALLDVDGTVLEPNRLSWQSCGYRREQVVGKKFWEGPWWSSSPPAVRRIEAACREAAAGRTFRAEMAYFVADGSERTVELVIMPIVDDGGHVLFLAQTGTDITDRKRAEAERQKFVTLVENSTDFIGMSDLQGVPSFINPAGLRMVGLDGMEEARRTNVREFFLPEDRSKVVDEFLPSVLEKGHGEIDIRFRHFRNGETRWMAYKVLTMTDEAAGPVGFATVSQDITERRRLEDNLRKLAADLSEADHRKDEFLATLAHELRNPLAPLGNMLEVLKRSGRDGDTLRQAVTTMERQLGQLVRLVDDLLDLSRITHNRLDLRKDKVELASIIDQAVLASRPLADSAGHEVRVVVPAEPIHLHADQVRLTQVIGNLLNNSCKYTAPGGRITVTAERHDGDVVVTVEDNGVGIPPDELTNIFEMFAQIEGSLERSQGGLGIGLTLVKRLVEMHGGSVEAKSDGEGQGSAFLVRLPVVDVPEQAAPRPSAREPEPPRRILVVDDNVDAASSLAMLLSLTGHETHTAHDGAAAIEAAERHRPEVVLLDIGLPVLNGYEVCRRIREQPWGEEMVLIALTGWGQEDDRRRSHEAGFDGHLVKPVAHGALVSLLGSLIAERHPG